MSTYEKVATAIIVILVAIGVAFSYHEITEPHENNGGPDFDHSIGQNFEIGPFDTILSRRSSGGIEQNCAPLQSVILGALHDVKEKLEAAGTYQRSADVFEVNQDTLQFFCNAQAEVTLIDDTGTKLVLDKPPFTRGIPAGGTATDVGTEVRIDATIVRPGTVPPTMPTVSVEELIPDRYLEGAVSSSTEVIGE
ncbi:MAG TPA: hypothetical protein VHC68_01155 [Candidatus Paceibacterota bacterium]|nr:hypothetical protein [Candidatus Paceibacterota bacterium]